MKYLLSVSLIALFLLTACSEERVLLNDLEGTWEITNFEFIDENGDAIVTDLTAQSLTLGDCDTDTNRNGNNCPASVTTTDGAVTAATYRATSAGATNQVLTMEVDGERLRDGSAPLLFKLLSQGFNVTFSGSDIQLTPTASPILRDADGNAVRFSTGVIDARRQ